MSVPWPCNSRERWTGAVAGRFASSLAYKEQAPPSQRCRPPNQHMYGDLDRRRRRAPPSSSQTLQGIAADAGRRPVIRLGGSSRRYILGGAGGHEVHEDRYCAALVFVHLARGRHCRGRYRFVMNSAGHPIEKAAFEAAAAPGKLKTLKVFYRR